MMQHCVLSATHVGKGQGKGSFIVMEYLNFGGSYSQADLGRALAEMHQAEPAVTSRLSTSRVFNVSGVHQGTSITKVM